MERSDIKVSFLLYGVKLSVTKFKTLNLTISHSLMSLRAIKATKFSPKEYSYFTHGYVATVHKTQGVTVDNTLVYVSGKKWDKYLMYVAMSRHRENCILHVDKSSFSDLNALEQQLKQSKQKENALNFMHQFAKHRGVKNENNSILRELKKLEKNIKIAEKQPYSYLKNATKEAFEKYVLKAVKDKKLLRQIEQKEPNLAKKAVKILEEIQRSL